MNWLGLKPDVIFSFGGEQAPFVKNATATIPVVVVVSNDPVASGLVASLGRPGDNLKTAKTLGLTIPEPLLGRADELIE
jgi:putative ABC transport system substrate-binding protein